MKGEFSTAVRRVWVGPDVTYLLVEAMRNESVIEVDETEEVAQGWKHALSNVISVGGLTPSQCHAN